MAYRDWSESRKRQVRYSAMALGLVVIAGGVLLWQQGTKEAAKSVMSPAASNAAAPEAKPHPSTDNPDIPNPKIDLAIQAIGDARRLAIQGKFAEAEAELKKADDAVPGMPETKQARDDIAAMQTPQGQLRLQLNLAELAIERDDGAAAEAALAKAEQAAPDSPDIAPLRQRLQELQQRKLKRTNRVAALLTAMREAIARHDFAAADDALNQASRIDISNPDVLKARIELNRAHNAAMRNEEEQKPAGTPAPR